MIIKKTIYLLFTLTILVACSSNIEDAVYICEYPEIVPDYKNINIPNNIAPLNFSFESEETQVEVKTKNTKFVINAKEKISFPYKQFKELLGKNINDTIWVTLYSKNNSKWTQYKPFYWKVEREQIDSFLTYRLIEPGYEVWNKITLAQRNTTNFTETNIADNNLAENSCMNCHIPNKHKPSQSFFHIRGKNSMTVIAKDKKMKAIDTKMKEAYSSMIYGSWHPTGKYIAFSTNAVLPSTHSIHNKRAFVYDTISDVVVLDLEKNEVLRTPKLMQKEVLETFPEFSADGSKLFFCSAKKVSLPNEHENLQYSICSIDFDKNRGAFGKNIDTLFNAPSNNKTASELKASPDGKHLSFNSFSCGTFALWHNDAKIYLYNLSTSKIDTLPKLNNNTKYANSYKSWSTNSSWLAFASKRDNGLYSKIYFSFIDENGEAHKPFVLPQKDPEHYVFTLKSYNVPELIKEKVLFDAFDIEEIYHTVKPEKLHYRK